ncbi:histidine phosphatase family protein [Sporanaerobium hydrogeniformans]|uniref:Histidine phosphatase family protein n=1 Tax=Sporanaerobium hydrogeniformans TaxID=3072179 RepID=A0AC61DAL9_9FIRM|nr:histidine phosphatase family protein [Sporanaerobium hydrogeniformans]PHV69572.1 histidine phosphatase family protein [Sporanaerobium hydrogeniformans]
MHTTVLLIRHGETEWNLQGKIQGTQNIPLSHQGKAQAQLLAKRLHGTLDYVYSSPLERAFQTAQILCTSTSLTPLPLENLKEVDFGSWEGLNFKEVATTYPEAFNLWRTDEVLGPLIDGEGNLKKASLRATSCVLEVVQKHPGKHIAMVSHGGLIKCAIMGLLDLKMTMYHHLALGNTCITTFQFDERLHPVLLGINDTHHLNTASPTAV